jgi:2-C-methyl-D-erythritol 4-phosphate cytidylyltransferase
MIEEKKVSAIVLAGGKGKRMGTEVSKQYLDLEGYPVLYYSLKAFEESLVDEIILVTAQGEEEYCRTEIVEHYHFGKVKQIVHGGKERYHSVFEGLCAVKDTGVVMIHDGARAFITPDIINHAAEMTLQCSACVVAIPVKDTIKVADDHKNIIETPDRNHLWQIQTPQCFDFQKIYEAYQYVLQKQLPGITDDAMVWEKYYDIPIKLIEGSYYNIKITTPEDMVFGRAILRDKKAF